MIVFIYIFIVPPYENPDELTHIRNTLKTKDLLIQPTGDGKLYYFLNKKMFDFFNYRSKDVRIVLNYEFDYFSDEYRYSNDKEEYLVSLTDSHFFRLLNFIYLYFFDLFPFFANKKYNKILCFFFLFPGFIYFMSCYNPDLLIVLCSITVLLLIFERKY